MNYCNCPNCATDDCPAAKKADNGTTHWNGTTHYAGCIQSGPKHYECALQEIGRLRLTITHLRAELAKAQSEYICTCGIRVTPHRCPTDNDF